MNLRAVLLLLFLPLLSRGIEIRDVPAPTGAGAMGSSLAAAPDGSLWLSWLEPAGGGNALRLARFDANAGTWTEPRTIAEGHDWFVNWADFPTVTWMPGGKGAAFWFVNRPAAGGHHASYYAQHSRSADGGKTWSVPQALTLESLSVEFSTALPMNGSALAAWLDGRARAHGGDHQTLCGRLLDSTDADTIIDPSVCDCCQLSFVPLPDNGALLAYRGRTADEVRDIRIARYQNGRWGSPQILHADDWKIPACPVNGPRLAAHGSRVVALWFTAAQNDARVQVKLSADAGESFDAPQRVDLGRPQGRVDAIMLEDGTAVVTWVEMIGRASGTEGGIYLRTLAPSGELSAPAMLAASSTRRASGFPRIAPLGGRRLLLTYTADAEPTRVHTLLVTLD